MRLEQYLLEGKSLDNLKDRKSFQTHKYSIGDYWSSPQGERKIVGMSGNKFKIKTGGNPFEEILSQNDISFDVFRDVSNSKSRQKAGKQIAKDIEIEKEKMSLYGYEDTLNPKQKAIAIKSLNKSIKNNGVLMKIKDMVKKYVDLGAELDKKEGKPAFVLKNGTFVISPSKHSTDLFRFLRGKR